MARKVYSNENILYRKEVISLHRWDKSTDCLLLERKILSIKYLRNGGKVDLNISLFLLASS